ncbi:hypothetical protein B9Z55_024632 [Caenorhabditis nigoni]|nr:hypothetical protein B9Z55_024632 [Caenorhabditis nigoni]
MREHKTASDRTRQLQKQLFKALVLQTLIPTIFMYSPTGVMFIAPFFSIDLNANANFIVFCSFLYPGLDPLILILIIRDFRQTVFMFICLRKKNSVDESRSTTRANMSQCWKADPCDDFYRYACPRGDYGLLTTVDFRDLIDDVKYQRIGENWKNALIRSDYETFKKRVKRITSKYGLISFFTKSFSSICKSDEKSIPSFVSNMGKVLSRVLNNGSIRSHIENEIYGCKIEDEDFERIITQYFDGFQRLDRTPWARNFNGTGKIQNLIRQIDMNKNVTDSIDEQHRLLSNINENYRTCSSQYRNIQSFEKLCFVFTATPLEYIEPPFFDNENAVNRQNSFLAFGLSFFYYNTYSKWRAAKLGFTGFTVGHEMAHTFVEVHRNPRELGYFSKESQKCVQDQFQKSCDFFGEGECYAALSQFDDNGADIFGLQLAYDLLEKDMSQQMKVSFSMGHDSYLFLKHTVNGLGKFGVTNEQLFFYAYAFGFCSGKESSMDLNKMQKTGEHSANNVRINVAAQHPGFQKAFQCSDDSRMMRSATDQCIIYGKYAPETRKKFIQPK